MAVAFLWGLIWRPAKSIKIKSEEHDINLLGSGTISEPSWQQTEMKSNYLGKDDRRIENCNAEKPTWQYLRLRNAADEKLIARLKYRIVILKSKSG